MEKISTRQMIYLLTLNRIATFISIMSLIHIGPANQDIWIMIVVSVFYNILIIFPILFLSSKFKDLTIIGYMERIFGKIIGKVIGIIYGTFFIWTTIYFFYITTKIIRIAFMPELSSVAIMIVLMIVALYTVSRELEVIGRAGELFGPIIIVSLLIYLALGLNNIDTTTLLPMYSDSSFAEINLGGIQLSLMISDIYILAMCMPNLANKKDLNKIAIKSIIYSLLMIMLMVLLTQFALGVEQAKHSTYPFLTYIRIVRTYSVFERIESAYLVTWTVTVLIRVVSYLYISSYAFKEILGKNDIRKFAYIIAIIIAGVTYYFSDINPMVADIQPPSYQEYIYYFLLKAGIPLIAMVIYFIRRKSFENQERLSE